MRHRDDAARLDLEAHTAPEDARLLATYDDGGGYRPLKTAPNLRRGWRLELPDVAAVQLALDFFYPAQLGLWLARREGRLRATSLRETVGRQTGMYRITGTITAAQADGLVSAGCRSEGGCLRAILWPIEPDGARASGLPAEKFDPAYDQTGGGQAVIPLLCAELCNLQVAAARELIKGKKAEAEK